MGIPIIALCCGICKKGPGLTLTRHKGNDEMRYQLDLKKLGMCARRARNGRGLRETAEEISREAGEISPSTLSRIEGERVDDIATSTFLTVCSWLNIPPAEFIIDQDGGPENAPPAPDLAGQIETLLVNSQLDSGHARVLAAAVRAGVAVARPLGQEELIL